MYDEYAKSLFVYDEYAKRVKVCQRHDLISFLQLYIQSESTVLMHLIN